MVPTMPGDTLPSAVHCTWLTATLCAFALCSMCEHRGNSLKGQDVYTVVLYRDSSYCDQYM